VRSFFAGTARRSVGIAGLLFFALPVGLSVIGCGSKSTPVQYCSAGDSGPIVGQVAKIVLAPNFATVGESINFGQIGSSLSATAYDCKGNAVSASGGYTFATTSSYNVNQPGGPIFADINPRTGQVCGGTWNRNTGGGIPDYTTCTAPSSPPNSYLAYATATSNGEVSNPIAVFVHPVVTGIELGGSTPTVYTIAGYSISSTGLMTNADGTMTQIPGCPASSGCTIFTTTTAPPAVGAIVTLGNFSATVLNGHVATVSANTPAIPATGNAPAMLPSFTIPLRFGQDASAFAANAGSAAINAGTDFCPNNTTGTVVTALPYDGTSCLSQTKTGRLLARIYQGGNTSAANDITCQVGHIAFAAQTPNIATIDQNGVATANQPGSTVITATISNSSTATQAGFLSTCPPASITLSVPSQPGASDVDVALNNTLPLTATVLDTNNLPITGLALTFLSTTPQTIPAGNGTVTPTFPGSADITVTCLPSSCNPSPFSQIGLFGNGKPITSNAITVNAAGTSSTVLYMASTQSQYVMAQDFTTNQPGTLIKLPYVPNSMVINLSGTGVFLGSPQGLMTFATANNLLGATNQSIPGIVLAISPDGSTLLITDPSRDTISLVTSSGGVVSTYGGTATEAHWSPDAQTVYVTTTTGEVLTHSTFTDWQTPNPAPSEAYTDVALTVPFVGGYFAGPTSTDGRSYCSSSTVASSGNPPAVINSFIPLADSKAVSTDRIAATTDGKHMIGAHAVVGVAGASTLSDLLLGPPVLSCPIPPSGGGASTPVAFTSSVTAYPLPGISAATITGVSTPTQAPMAITGVYTSPNSLAAFASYTGSGGLLPFYAIPSSGTGTLKMLPLTSGATSAPVSGVFSTDNFSFYAGTTVDNAVHIISLTYPTGGQPTAADSGTITPALPDATGTTTVPVNLLVQRPKKSTN
jgi:hypothetical protein